MFPSTRIELDGFPYDVPGSILEIIRVVMLGSLCPPVHVRSAFLFIYDVRGIRHGVDKLHDDC